MDPAILVGSDQLVHHYATSRSHLRRVGYYDRELHGQHWECPVFVKMILIEVSEWTSRHDAIEPVFRTRQLDVHRRTSGLGNQLIQTARVICRYVVIRTPMLLQD